MDGKLVIRGRTYRNNFPTDLFNGEKHFVIVEVGEIGTSQYGPFIVFVVMSSFFLLENYSKIK